MSMERETIARELSEDEVLAWVAEMFEEPRERIARGTPRDAVPAWDSLGQLVLMAQLDERFTIRLTEAELSSLASVGDILEVLRRHGRLADSPAAAARAS